MKALFINGSPRKNGNTAKLLQRAMEGAEAAGAEVEWGNLYDRKLNIKGCMSCFACKVKGGKKGVCSFKDEQSKPMCWCADHPTIAVTPPLCFAHSWNGSSSLRLTIPTTASPQY